MKIRFLNNEFPQRNAIKAFQFIHYRQQRNTLVPYVALSLNPLNKFLASRYPFLFAFSSVVHALFPPSSPDTRSRNQRVEPRTIRQCDPPPPLSFSPSSSSLSLSMLSFFFSSPAIFFIEGRGKKAHVPREPLVTFPFNYRDWIFLRRKIEPSLFFAPNVHGYTNMLLWTISFIFFFFFLFGSSWRIVVVEGNGGLLSSFESLPERTNRRWPIFISAISALWGTRGERCVMLVKCDLFLFLCVCVYVYIYIFFFKRRKEREIGRISDDRDLEEFVLQHGQTSGKTEIVRIYRKGFSI